MVKRFATRIPRHVQPVGRPCGTLMHYSMRDVKDMGQQMGYRSLEPLTFKLIPVVNHFPFVFVSFSTCFSNNLVNN